MAGGTTQHGYDKLISLKRRNQHGRFDLLTLDLSADNKFKLQGGDFLNVAKSEDRFVEVVEVLARLSDLVHINGVRGWTYLIFSLNLALKNSDLRFGYIVRQNEARNFQCSILNHIKLSRAKKQSFFIKMIEFIFYQWSLPLKGSRIYEDLF